MEKTKEIAKMCALPPFGPFAVSSSRSRNARPTDDDTAARARAMGDKKAAAFPRPLRSGNYVGKAGKASKASEQASE